MNARTIYVKSSNIQPVAISRYSPPVQLNVSNQLGANGLFHLLIQLSITCVN